MTEKLAALIDRFTAVLARHPRGLLLAGVGVAVVLLLARVVALDADFPVNINSRLVRDSVLFTDEGWYSSNAMAWFRTGEWHQPGDMNFAVNLPVQQLLQALVFLATGPGVVGVRLTSVLCFMVSTLATALVMLRFERPWVAVVTAVLMATNFFAFAYSRTGLSETVMMMWVMLGALAVAHGDRPGWRGNLLLGLAGVALAMGVLTKTSAAIAGPVLVVGAGLMNRGGRAMWWRPALVLAGAAVPLVLHRVLLAGPYRADFDYFHTINVGMNFSFNIYDGTMVALDMMDRMVHMDKVLYYAVRYAAPAMLILSPAFRGRATVWMALWFVAMYLGAFAFYGNVQPRYWAALVPPLAMVVASALAALHEDRCRHWGLGALFVGMVLTAGGATANNLALVGKHFTRLEYTVATAVSEMQALMRQAGAPNDVVLGHFACNFALYGTFHPVNDLYAPSTLQWRLERYRPSFLVTEGEVVPAAKHYLEHLDSNPAERLRRYDVLTEHFEMEELGHFTMLERYKDYDVYFYRLHPKPHLLWGDGREARANE